MFEGLRPAGPSRAALKYVKGLFCARRVDRGEFRPKERLHKDNDAFSHDDAPDEIGRYIYNGTQIGTESFYTAKSG